MKMYLVSLVKVIDKLVLGKIEQQNHLYYTKDSLLSLICTGSEVVYNASSKPISYLEPDNRFF